MCAITSIFPSPCWLIAIVSPRFPTRLSTLILSCRNFSKAETSKILSEAGWEALMMNCRERGTVSETQTRQKLGGRLMMYLLRDLSRLLAFGRSLSQSASALSFLYGGGTLSLLLLDVRCNVHQTNSKAMSYIQLLLPCRLTNGPVAKRCVSYAVVFKVVYSVWLGVSVCGQVLAYFSAIWSARPDDLA